MGLLDLDYDPLTGKKKKTDAEKVREALTPSKKRRIREAVGNRCEIPQCKSDAYDVHHIKPVKEGGTNVDNNLNVASNLIVLCANHHRDVHDGKRTKTELRNIVKKRSKKTNQVINNILRSRKKVGKESSSSKKTRSPFDISSFTPPSFNTPSFDSPFDATPKKKGRKKK